MVRKNNEHIFFSLVLIIFFFHLVHNIVIVNQHNVPLFFDEGGFYNLSVLYNRHLLVSSNISNFFHHLYSISTFYPPLVFILKIPFFSLFGVSPQVSILSNSLFLFILFYFVFLIGKYLGGAKIGLLSVFIVSFYPGIYGFARTNFMTIPMTASVTMSYYFLLRSEIFSNRKFSILFGISMAIGLLIKWLNLIYIAPAVLVCIFIATRNRTGNDFSKRIKNLSIAILLSLVLAAPWYIPNIRNLLPMIMSGSYDNPNWANFKQALLQNPFRLGLLKLLVMLEQYQLFSLYTLLALYFTFRYLIIEKNSYVKWLLMTSLFIPYFLFSLVIIEYYSGTLNPRYVIPLFPLISLITAKGVCDIKKVILKKIFIVAIVLVGIVQFYWTWVVYGRNGNASVFSKDDFQKYTTRGLLSPKKVDWKIKELVDAIRDKRSHNKIEIMIIPHTPLTSALNYALQLNREGNLIFPLNATFLAGEYKVIPKEKYVEAIERVEFVLTQEGGDLSYDDSPWIQTSIKYLQEEFEKQKSEFYLVKEEEIDSGSFKLLLYKRIRQAPQKKVLSEPEGEGILMRALDFFEGNLVYNSEFGLTIDGGVSPAYVQYEVKLPYDGKYEVWVKYATQQIRPVEIYFDGELIKFGALTKFTQGWTYSDAVWFKEADIEAGKGTHSLKFVAKTTPFPHLDSIKIIYKNK